MSTIVGFDPGNSEASIVAHPNEKIARLTIPSFTGSGTLGELKRIRGAVSAKALESGELALEFGGRSMFVGRLALEQSGDPDSARGNTSRYWTGHSLNLLLASAGALFKERELSLRVVTGLPVSTWSRDTVKHVQRSLVGPHRFVLNGQERELTVEGVMVLMEGAGALAALGKDEDVPQAVIDIGGRTTDLFWAQGMKPVMPRCSNTAVGVEKIGDLLRRSFEEKYGRPLTPNEVRSLLQAWARGVEGPAVYVDGERVGINGQLKAAVDAVAGEIASFVSQVWRSSEQGRVASEAARVFLIGGGAHYFDHHLRSMIGHLDVPKEPELANASGYLRVGQSLPDEAWARLRG